MGFVFFVFFLSFLGLLRGSRTQDLVADTVKHSPVSISPAKLHLVEGIACRLGLVCFAILNAPAEVGSAEGIKALEDHLCGLKEADKLSWAAIDARPLVH